VFINWFVELNISILYVAPVGILFHNQAKATFKGTLPLVGVAVND